MKCPYCGSDDTRVVNSRESQGGEQIRRRRECNACGQRFTTRETIDRQIYVVKKDNSREPFDREKIKRGLAVACSNRNVSADQMDRLATQVEREIMNEITDEVPSHKIGEKVLRHLRGIDEVAYIRFASVYRRFQSIGEFRDELDKLAGRAPGKEG